MSSTLAYDRNILAAMSARTKDGPTIHPARGCRTLPHSTYNSRSQLCSIICDRSAEARNLGDQSPLLIGLNASKAMIGFDCTGVTALEVDKYKRTALLPSHQLKHLVSHSNMRVFVTGANGFIGQSTVKELQKHGHHVVGLARSEANVKAYKEAGVEPFEGTIDDPESLKKGAQACDGVIHLAFRHDLMATDFAKAATIDNEAVKALCEALEGTNKPLVIAAGTLSLPHGRLSFEDDETDRRPPFGLRAISGDIVQEYAKKGVRGSIIRLTPTVHGAGDQGFVPIVINAARKNGVVTYIGDGSSRWPAGHRDDAAVLFRLALEKGKAGAYYHGVAEEGVAWKDITAVIGRKLNLPIEGKMQQEAMKDYGFLAHVIGADNPTSSERTRKELGWEPKQIGLLEDMEKHYF